MAILADALEDAGCTDQEILNHCREEMTHCRCCPVLNAILGKDKEFGDLDAWLVDHDLSLAEVIQTREVFQMYEIEITPRAQIERIADLQNKKGKEEVIFRLFEINRNTTTKKVINEMEGHGYRPSSLKEALWYGNLPEKIGGENSPDVVTLSSSYLGRCEMVYSPIITCGDGIIERIDGEQSFGKWDGTYYIFPAILK